MITSELWQLFVVLFIVTLWVSYREFLKRYHNANEKQKIKEKQKRDEDNMQISIIEINRNHKNYIERIETEFQELLKSINESETEINALRREKWQSDLQTRAWRHACRDAQQMVWALQRQGCAAGSDLTYFKPIESISTNNNEKNQQSSEDNST